VDISGFPVSLDGFRDSTLSLDYFTLVKAGVTVQTAKAALAFLPTPDPFSRRNLFAAVRTDIPHPQLHEIVFLGHVDFPS
jgi:hypothetical protein